MASRGSVAVCPHCTGSAGALTARVVTPGQPHVGAVEVLSRLGNPGGHEEEVLWKDPAAPRTRDSPMSEFRQTPTWLLGDAGSGFSL